MNFNAWRLVSIIRGLKPRVGHRTFVHFAIQPLKLWVAETAERLHMPVEARAEGGCTGQAPGHGRVACARPGQRARDVRHDVAPLVFPLGASTAQDAAR